MPPHQNFMEHSIMITDLPHAVWILEIETGENTGVHLCCERTPTEREFATLQEMLRREYGDVSIRILSKKEVIAAKLEVDQHEFVEWCDPSELPLTKNKRACRIN